MMKKQLRLKLCTMFMVLLNLGAYVQAQDVDDTFNRQGFRYKITSLSPRTVTTLGYTNTGGGFHLDILATVQYASVIYTVTAIGDNAFQEKELTSVTIPNSVTSIGIEAFMNNQLTSVTIPDNVSIIGARAFHTNQLTHVDFGNGVTSIGNGAFNTNLLERLELPASLNSIESYAFSGGNPLTVIESKNGTPPALGTTNVFGGRKGLIDLTVPDGTEQAYFNGGWNDFRSINGVIQVGARLTIEGIAYEVTSVVGLNTVKATGYTGSATEVDIPAMVQYNNTDYKVTAIGEEAFKGKQLTSVTIPDNVRIIGARAFQDNELTHVDFGNGVTTIANGAFHTNQLEHLVLPASLSSIESYAFSGGNPLTVIESKNGTPPTLGPTNVFGGRKGFIDLLVPKGTKQAYENAGWTGFKSVTEPKEVGDVFTVGDIQYEITSLNPNTVKAKDYTGTATEVNIPETVQGYTVTAIGDNAFQDNQLTSVTIPNSVTSIGIGAFVVNKLTSVTIGEGVTSIGGAAFSNNQLASVTIPDGVTSIENNAFRDNQLTSVTIGEGVTSIGAGAFSNNQLASVTIPNSVTSIGVDAFRENQLTSVTIPDSVTSIGAAAFVGNQLTSVTIGEGVTSIGGAAFAFNALKEVVIPNRVTSIGVDAFRNNQLTIVTIGDGVTSIGNLAFDNNQLTSVTIPEGVTSIRDQAFATNPITVVVSKNETPPTFIDAFSSRANIDLFVPKGAIDAYKNNGWTFFKSYSEIREVGETFNVDGIKYEVTSLNPLSVMAVGYTGSGGALAIPETVQDNNKDYTVTAIGIEAFKGKQLTSVALPNSVTTIGDEAFRNNTLTSVGIPSNVTSIGQYAFRDNQLTSIDLGDGDNLGIGWGAFLNNRLLSLFIPDRVKNIGGEAFAKNVNLATVTVEATNPPSLHARGFEDRDRGSIHLRFVHLGSVAAYRNNGWNGFQSYTSTGDIQYEVTASLPNGTVTIIDYTGSATEVDIPQTVQGYTVTAIGDNAFQDKGLTSVTIPDGVTSIGDFAFKNNQLASVALPNSVTTIGDEAFRNNTLTSVGIPSNVTSIGQYAFRDNQLTSIDLGDGANLGIGWGAFLNNRLLSLFIPDRVKNIGGEAFAKNLNLATVTVEATNPPSLHARGFEDRDRGSIHLRFVHLGTIAAYRNNGWNGFQSYTNTGDIQYEVTASLPNGTVTIIDYTGSATEVDIPQTVQGYTVTAIGDNAFQYQNNVQVKLTRVTLPNGITTIGDRAFADNAFTEVALPSSVTVIKAYAFWNNNPMTEVVIPGSVTTIEDGAFGSIDNLATVRVEATTPPSLHENGFTNRNAIDLIVPDGTEQTYLDSGWNGFRSINGLPKVGAGLTIEGIAYEVTSLSPNTVKAVGYTGSGGALAIPETVQDNNTDYTVTAIGQEAFKGKQLTSVTIPESVIRIGIRAFQDNELTHVDFGNGVTTIANGAFHTNKLNRIELPSGLTGIESYAFSGDNPLTVIVSKNGTPPGLGETNAFGNRRGFINLYVPVGAIEAYRSNGWTGFKSVSEIREVGDTFAKDGIEYKVTALSPNTVTAVDYKGTATIVDIPETVQGYTVTVIGESAFFVPYSGDNLPPKLTEVTIPNSIISIGNNAFANNELTSLTLPIDITTIGEDVFANNDLTEVSIPSSVTAILKNAFWNNNPMTEVVIPSNVTTIREGAFGSIEDLATVRVLARIPPSLNTNGFTNRNTIDLIVPEGTIETYENDEDWFGFRSISGNNESFITTWAVTETDKSITIPINPNYTYDFQVDWGDGEITSVNTNNPEDTALTHTYPDAGTYEVKIAGTFPAIYFNNAGDKDKIQTVKQWGNVAWLSMLRAFYGCSNLEVTAPDAPILGQVMDMRGMFRSASGFTGQQTDLNRWDVSSITMMGALFSGASAFNQDINGWNVSNVEDMSTMFLSAIAFNQDIGDWDVSSVINMGGMFEDAEAFNGNIGGWNVSNVTKMDRMFFGASAFNQDIGGWDVGNVTNMFGMLSQTTAFNGGISDWDVDKVTNMGYMFRGSAFNGDVSRWDVSSVTNMNFMFSENTAFNQDLGAWKLNSVTDMDNIFENSIMDCANTANTLMGWADNPDIASGIALTVGNYDASAATAVSNLESKGWTITGTEVSNCTTLSINNELFSSTLRVNNPVTHVLTIMGPEGFELKEAKLYNLLGNQVLRTTNTTVNTGSLPSGLYILKIENTAGQMATKKIIKR